MIVGARGIEAAPAAFGVRLARTGLSPAAAFDLLAKMILVAFLVRLAADPAWGNLEGKAPLGRAVIYPCLSLVVPAIYVVLGRSGPFPWRADLLVTLAGFSDILGNRLDLYDKIHWFDDWIHFMNTGFIAAAALLLTSAQVPFVQLLERAVAVGLSTSLAWEVWEYYAFVTRSGESASAYGDTVGDLVLGGLGAAVAAATVALARPRVRPTSPTCESPGSCGRVAGVEAARAIGLH